MKKLKNLAFLLILGMIATSCGEDPPPPPSEEEVQTTLLAKPWTVGTSANDITLDTQDEIANWAGFSVVFSASGTYTTTNVSTGRETVWPSQGSWTYKGTTGADLNTIIRDAGTNNETTINLTVDEVALKMTFNYTDPVGRTDGTEGDWAFNMTN